MGWTTEAAGRNHRFFLSNGKIVASVLQVQEGHDDWVPQVLEENLERKAAEATRLGATIIDIIDIEGVARTASLKDSENTLFGLWQPAPHRGAELANEIGHLWWIEVLSNNVKRARDLYMQLFGWTAVEKVFEPFRSYIFFKDGETNESGILPIEPNWGIQPRWNSIFSVADCDATIARALELGGCEEFVHTVPTAGRVGVFRDPGHAIFLVRGPLLP